VSQACGSISGLHQILANKSKSLYETQVLEIPIPTFCYMEERKKERKNSAVHQNSFTSKYFIMESSFRLVAINFPLGYIEREVTEQS
jgi:hypothetical protein